MARGVAPGSAEAHALAERHFAIGAQLSENFSYELHRVLGRMLLTDRNFRAPYEQITPGLARYVSEVIDANANRHLSDDDSPRDPADDADSSHPDDPTQSEGSSDLNESPPGQVGRADAGEPMAGTSESYRGQPVYRRDLDTTAFASRVAGGRRVIQRRWGGSRRPARTKWAPPRTPRSLWVAARPVAMSRRIGDSHPVERYFQITHRLGTRSRARNQAMTSAVSPRWCHRFMGV